MQSQPRYLSEIILESLKKAGCTVLDLFDEISLKRRDWRDPRTDLYYRDLKARKKKKRWAWYIEDWQTRQKRALAKALHKLEKDGLIRKHKAQSNLFWKITRLGKEKLSKIKTYFIWPKADYPKEKSQEQILVIFDVPEKQKEKREWLRFILISLGFVKLQKSVFIGNIKIPKQFLTDIYDLNLAECVHIFKVTKSGTLSDY